MPVVKDRFVFDSDGSEESAVENSSILLVDDEENVLDSLRRTCSVARFTRARAAINATRPATRAGRASSRYSY